MTDNQRWAGNVLAEVEQYTDVRRRQHILAAALDEAEARGRAEVAAKVAALAAARETSAARWTESIDEAGNDTDAGYFSGRAHAEEQVAIRLRELVAGVTQ